MGKNARNSFTSIILWFLTISLVVPMVHISALQVDKPPSTNNVAETTTEQISKDSVQDVKTSESESDKTNHANSHRVSPQQSEQKLEVTSGIDSTPLQTKQPIQTPKSSPGTDSATPRRVGMIFVKIVGDNRIDLKWTGIKGPDFNHYNVYMGMKPSFKVLPGVTVPSGTSNTNSYSSTGLNPSTRYYYKIAAVDDANNIGPLSNTKTGITKGAATSTQINSPHKS